MACNWELYELRVLIFHRGKKNPVIMEANWEFGNVSIDFRHLGIPGFSGNGLNCNFKTVFSRLANMKQIPFFFNSEIPSAKKYNFDNLVAAYKNNVTLGVAKLYVHRRDSFDLVTSVTGPAILLETVTVEYAVKSSRFDARLSGQLANVVNV